MLSVRGGRCVRPADRSRKGAALGELGWLLHQEGALESSKISRGSGVCSGTRRGIWQHAWGSPGVECPSRRTKTSLGFPVLAGAAWHVTRAGARASLVFMFFFHIIIMS